MKDNVLCAKCARWVDCSTTKNVIGFCLDRDLFTYTKILTSESCPEYLEGNPLTEKEYESYNKGC